MNRASFYSRETTAADYLQARAPRELWAAVLAQAVDDVTKPIAEFETRGMTPAAAQEYRGALRVAAEEWVADGEVAPRRFVWVCRELGMDPGAVRRRIVEQRAAA